MAGRILRRRFMRMRRGKAFVEGSAADGFLEDGRGGCSTTPTVQFVGLGAIYDGREGEDEAYCCREILHVDAVVVLPRRFTPLKRSGFFPPKRVMTDCERHCISIYSKPTRPT